VEPFAVLHWLGVFDNVLLPSGFDGV